MKQETCSQCKFFVPAENRHTKGACVRYPPTLIQTREDGLRSMYPGTMPDLWCGEWKLTPNPYDTRRTV